MNFIYNTLFDFDMQKMQTMQETKQRIAIRQGFKKCLFFSTT
jgi:uncharacterized membrane protein